MLAGLALAPAGSTGAIAGPPKPRSAPNVLLVSIDDLNDWIEPLGGYPGAITPNFNRLASMSRVFQRAYTPAPSCCPARTAALFGIHPHRSGVYTNYESWVDSAYLRTRSSLPRYLKDRGFATFGTGKIFHSGNWTHGADQDPGAWTHLEHCHASPLCTAPRDPLGENGIEYDVRYGPVPNSTPMPDVIRSTYIADEILRKVHDRPFFAALGLKKPHIDLTVPKKFFDLYPMNKVVYPPGVLDRENPGIATNLDVQDLPSTARALLRGSVPEHLGIVGSGEWKKVIRAYLASISFADHCLGIVLDALLEGPNRDNTYVFLFGDNGWQLGEKLAWQKFTLWERALRVPMMIAGPGIAPGDAMFPVSLLDLFPTVTDVALGQVPGWLHGRTLADHLFDSALTPSGAPVALSAWRLAVADPLLDGPHFSVRSSRFRLTKYRNGEMELYDHSVDPWEWHNLYTPDDPWAVEVAQSMAAYVPPSSQIKPPAPRSG